MPAAGLTITKYIQSKYNGEVLGVDEDNPNLVRIKHTANDGTVRELKTDVKSLMKEDAEKEGLTNFDPSTVPLSDASKPLQDSGLPFMRQIAYAMAGTKGDKAKFLKENFGEGNVAFSKDTGEFSVKKSDGNWYKGEMSSALANIIGSEGTTIAGSVGGAKIGGVIGGPAGLAIGAGLGAVVGRLTNLGIAHATGVRTEEDAFEIAKTLGADFVLAMSGEKIAQGIGSAALKLKNMSPEMFGYRVGKAFSNLGDEITKNAGTGEAGFVSKYTTAEAASQLNGLPPIYNMHSLERGMEVLPHQQRTIKYLNSDAVKRGVNPVYQEQVDIIKDSVEKARDTMYKEYDNAFKPLGKAFEDAHVDLQSPAVRDSLLQPFKDMQLVDANGAWRTEIDRMASAAPMLKATDINAMKKMYNQLQAATWNTNGMKGYVPSRELGAINMKQVISLTKSIDNFLEARPILGIEVSNGTQRAFTQLRQNIRGLINDTLGKGPKSWQEAGVKYNDLSLKFQGRRTWLDDLSSSFEDNGKVEKMMKRILDAKSNNTELESLKNLLQDTGIDPNKLVADLMDREVGIKSAPLFVPGTKGLGSLFNAPMGPRLTTRGLASLSAKGKMVEAVQKLSPAAKTELIKNPKALSAMSDTVKQAPDAQEAISRNLMQQAGKQISGQ